MFNLDTETGRITLPQGDTAQFIINLKCGKLPEGTAAVFGIAKVKTAPYIVESIFAKAFDVIDNSVLVRLTNKDTRDLAPGDYIWDARIVTDPDRNDAGEVRAYDPGDNVYSIFSGTTDMPPFIVTGASADV